MQYYCAFDAHNLTQRIPTMSEDPTTYASLPPGGPAEPSPYAKLGGATNDAVGPADYNKQGYAYTGQPPPGYGQQTPPGYTYAAQPPPYNGQPQYAPAYPGQPPPGYPMYQTPTTVYVQNGVAYAANPNDVVVLVEDDGQDSGCAFFGRFLTCLREVRAVLFIPYRFAGMIFSWIPIIGWITFCMHYGAPPGSRRHRFARLACAIATVVFIINMVVVFTV